MYDAELEKVSRKLHFRDSIGLLKDRKVYLFGVSENTRQIIRILREIGIEPVNVIDNDITKQGSYCGRLKVIPVSDIDTIEGNRILILIYSSYWREMMPQLITSGINRKNIWQLFPCKKSYLGLVRDAAFGKHIRKKLTATYGDIPIFVCPYTGSGDIYLIGTFWNEYLRKIGIEEYIFVVITSACQKIASMFNIKNIVRLEKKKYAEYLISYYLMSPWKGNIKILNDCWAQVHTNQTEWFRGFKGLYFTDLFRRFVFDLPNGVKPEHPVLDDSSQRIHELFDNYELNVGKTIILSPYSNTLADLPDDFWESLVNYLAYKDFCIVTNSSGATEPPVNGTKAVFFPLEIMPQIVEAAGYFVGVRSGLCDVISSAKAKKVILYDARDRFYMGSAFEYFNLKGMELCDDALELEYSSEDLNRITEQILGYLNN